MTAGHSNGMHPFFKTLIWFLGNAAFGLAPLLLLYITYIISSNELFGKEIHQLIKGGIVLFLCSAIMGTVTLDVLNNSKLKIESKWTSFFLYISPFIVVAILLFVYILMVLEIFEENIFATFSGLYWIIIPFSTVYSFISKFYLFSNE